MYEHLTRSLPAHLFIVEYPGYGILNGKCNAQTVVDDSEHVYNFIVEKLNVDPNRLIILGQKDKYPLSIGKERITHVISTWSNKQQIARENVVNAAKSKHEQKDRSNVIDATTDTNTNAKATTNNLSDCANVANQTEQKSCDSENFVETPTRVHPNPEKVIPSEIRVFDNLQCIENADCDLILLFHGTDDNIIPFKHSEHLKDRLSNIKKQSQSSQLRLHIHNTYRTYVCVHFYDRKEAEEKNFPQVRLIPLNRRGHNNIDINQDVAIKVFRELQQSKHKHNKNVQQNNEEDSQKYCDIQQLAQNVDVLCKKNVYEADRLFYRNNRHIIKKVGNEFG
ncbi:hypothetical protein RFI_08651 [Reticulomyxa filosa]|uniref:Peptidase S9 prolyl oligopeptidase catalytic domain-containing protein n=1 Tax=Reticulomyxa filosa TaxID=46433 RepID=X6NR52_RETFI|nr:hypothetical protein RFI_08651 [Reticulomyxa filosa]|eukprot:ETO28481.1 hypothetical protein RFI_08651 [Reticulomyxa filosa]